jgi:hypothetical protein
MKEEKQRRKSGIADPVRDEMGISQSWSVSGAFSGFICVHLCLSVDDFEFKWNDSL